MPHDETGMWIEESGRNLLWSLHQCDSFIPPVSRLQSSLHFSCLTRPGKPVHKKQSPLLRDRYRIERLPIAASAETSSGHRGMEACKARTAVRPVDATGEHSTQIPATNCTRGSSCSRVAAWRCLRVFHACMAGGPRVLCPRRCHRKCLVAISAARLL